MSEKSIPQGWTIARISEVSYKGAQQKPTEDESFVYVDISSINRDKKSIENPQYLIGVNAPSRARKVINKGDVLVSLTRPNLNAVALVPEKLDNQIASTGFEVIKSIWVESRYLFAITRSKHFIDSISGVVQGALYPAAKSKDVQDYQIPLPPLAEQKVIADKLDTLLAQVESTKSRLEHIPDILKRFRQSVLSSAVSGKLTEDWRKESFEDAKQELKNYLARNNEPLKKVEATSLHEIVTENFPQDWGSAKINAIYRIIDYRGKTPKKSQTGKRLYSAKNIKMGYLSNDPIEYLSEEDFKTWMTRGISKLGDIFFVTEGHTMGCTAMNSIGSDIALAQRTLTLQPRGEVDTRFHFYYMLSDGFQKLVNLNATGSAAKGIKASKFRGLPIPFPPFREQREIASRVETLFAYADRIEAQAKSSLERVNNLTQSILAKAFRGELTEKWRMQHPELISGENSAEALLARIQTERVALKPSKSKRRK